MLRLEVFDGVSMSQFRFWGDRAFAAEAMERRDSLKSMQGNTQSALARPRSMENLRVSLDNPACLRLVSGRQLCRRQRARPSSEPGSRAGPASIMARYGYLIGKGPGSR